MEDKIKKIYKVVTETPKLKDAFTGITEDQFRTALQDEKAQDALYDDLVAYDLVTKGDPNEFWTKKGLRQPKVATPPVPQPPAVSLAPPQRQSIEQQAAGQATGFVPPMTEQPEQPVFQPFVQFKNEAELQQTAKSPVFKDYSAASAVIADREKMDESNPLTWRQDQETGKFSVFEQNDFDSERPLATFDTKQQADAAIRTRNADNEGLIMPFKDAEADFAKMSPEQQAQAIAGSTGSKPNQDPIKQTGKLPVVPVGLIGLGTKAVNYGIDIWNSMKRGWTQGKAINQVEQGDLADAANGNPEALKKIDWNALAKTNREISEFGQTEGDKSMERAFSGDSVGINDFVDFFTALPGVTVESLANLARSGWDEATAGAVEGAALGSAVPGIGTVAGAGVGVTAGMIAAGRSMEYYMSLLEELKNKGVDVNNPETLKKGMAAYGKEASEVATTRANAITAVETLLPVLGKVLRLGGGKIAARAAGKLGKAGKVAEKVGGVLENEAIAGPLGGSAGELAAQVGSGQEINLKEIAAEAGGEGAATAAAVARAIKGRTTAPTPPTQLGGIPTIPAPPNAPEFVPPVPPPSGADQTTYETVTPEELQAFRQGQIDPERAAAIADDVALIQSGQMDINSIDDANYRLMVESAMGAGQQEQQQGGAAELSQINDRILTIKAAAQEGRIEGDPAEYAALKKRKAELESQVKTEVEVETDPAVADIERRREEELAKFREDNPIQLRPIEVLDQNGNVIQSSSGEFAINKKYDAEIAALQSKGTTTQQAAEEVSRNQELDNVVRNIPIEDVRRPNGAIGTQGFTSTQLKDLIKFINTNLNLGISEDLFNGEKLKPLIDYIKNSPDLVQKIQDYVKKDPIEISIMPDDTIIINDGNHRANLLNLIGSDVLPTIEAAQRNQVDEINAKYDALQSNATPQSETIVADQAAQNMGTAVNQPLETGAAAVEVGESGRPVVEVEGDQVVEEERVEVTPFKKGDGHTLGTFEDKQGKLYKSLQPTEARQNKEGVYERMPIENKQTDEYNILKELQGNPHIPKIGKIVQTSSGPAFEIERLDEVKNLSIDEYREVRKILDDLNDKEYHVGDKVTIMRRPKTNELVVVDFSAGYKGNRMSRDTEYLQNVEKLLSKKDQDNITTAQQAISTKLLAETLVEPDNQYYLTQRPPSIGTHPVDGFVSMEEETIDGRKMWKMQYDRPLSKEEIESYELKPVLSPSKYATKLLRHKKFNVVFHVKDINGPIVTLQNYKDGKSTEEQMSTKTLLSKIENGDYEQIDPEEFIDPKSETPKQPQSPTKAQQITDLRAKEQAEGKAEAPQAGSVVGGEVEEKVSGLQHTKSQLEEIAKEEGIDNAIASFKKDLSVKENRLAELTKYEKGKLPSQKTKTKEIQSLEKRIEEVRKDVENLEKIKVEQSLKEAPKPKGKATIIIEEKPKEPLIPKQKLEKIKEKVKSDPNVLLRTGKIEGKNTGFFAIPEQGGPFVDDSFNDLGINEETSAYTMPNDFKVKDLSNMVFDDYKKNKEDEKARAEGYDGVKIMEMDGTTVMDVVNPKKLIKLDESLPELRNEKLQEASSKTRKAEGGQSAKQSSQPTEKKPRKRGRSINVQAAMNVQLPNNKEAAVMQTILENPLSEDILQSIFGGPDPQAKSGRKSIKGERSARISMLKKNGVKSVGKMAELAASKLAEWDGSPDAMPNDFSDGLEDLVIDTILNYNSKESIANDLLAMANLEQQQFDEQWYAGQQNEDLVRESEGIVDALTDEEFVELLGLEDEGVAEFLDNWNEERAESEKSPEQKEAEKIVSEAKQKVSDAEKALKQASNAAGQSLNVPLGEKTPLGLTVQRGNADAQRKVKEAETALELAKSDLGKAESQLDKLKGKKTSQLEIDTKANPLTPFQTKGEEGQAARAALKESVGPKEFKRLENISRGGEKILKDLEKRGIIKIDCP